MRGRLRLVAPTVTILVAACVQGVDTRLSWDAPTQRTDGSGLERIDSYRIAWSREPGGPYDDGEWIVDAAARSANHRVGATVPGLRPGRYCFVVYARDANGLESLASEERCGRVGRGRSN